MRVRKPDAVSLVDPVRLAYLVIHKGRYANLVEYLYQLLRPPDYVGSEKDYAPLELHLCVVLYRGHDFIPVLEHHVRARIGGIHYQDICLPDLYFLSDHGLGHLVVPAVHHGVAVHVVFDVELFGAQYVPRVQELDAVRLVGKLHFKVAPALYKVLCYPARQGLLVFPKARHMIGMGVRYEVYVSARIPRVKCHLVVPENQ
ncbi:Uncharacterised protein [uncultured archaeon]|nr:Uncharacterised protein [uncultured archaeon]